jgi:hypothetical protein
MRNSLTRIVRQQDLKTIVDLQEQPGTNSVGRRSVAFVHPNHTQSSISSCLDRFPQGSFVSEEHGKIVGFVSAIRFPGHQVLEMHKWAEITKDGTGVSHDPAGKWLYVCRMLLTAGPGHNSLGPELSPLLQALKTVAGQFALDGIAIALPFPGFRDRSGTTDFQRQCLVDESGDPHRPHLSAMGPSASINVALNKGFSHEIALPDFTGGHRHFALMVWRNDAVG